MQVITLDQGIFGTEDYPQKIYSGFITATGTGGGNKLPSGWAVVKPTAGRYRIIHNLGLGTNKDLRVGVTLFGNTPAADKIYVKSIGSTRFVVETSMGGSLTASAFFFITILI